ncbi:MAG: ammonium transporter [Acidimicrobiales bacterium]|nr:ammonium transporter [Acidimicrobiales bacterium]
MVPGLALFYGGMSRSKNMLNMLMMNMICLGIVPLFWIVIGYSLSSTGTNQFIGSFDAFFLADIARDDYRDIFFALTFASITPALISGAVADRMKFSAWVVFVPVWMLLVFVPAWAWVFRFADEESGFEGGFLVSRGSLDFAGGTVVHVAAGAASLALVLVLGKRRGWPTEPMAPHNLTFTMLGAGILWFGWFGFNAGSAFAADGVAIQAFANTFTAGAMGMLGWLLAERIIDGHATSLGAASGIVAGLVGITPGAGFMGIHGAMAVGLAAGAVCALAVRLKFRFGYDDALDVVGVHMVGGLIGGVLIGFFASPSALLADGAFDGGLVEGDGAGLLLEQIFANVVVGVFSFAMTYAIAYTLNATMGIRSTVEEELEGLDLSYHVEQAYNS